MIVQPSGSRVNSVPELPSFACVCLSSSRRWSQLKLHQRTPRVAISKNKTGN